MIGVGRSAAFLYNGGKTTNLGSLGGSSGNTQPNGINASGEVVGYSYLPDGNFRGFLWVSGSMTALGTVGGDWSQAYAINNVGVITGTAYTSGNLGAPAFILSKGAMKNLGTLGALMRRVQPSTARESSWATRTYQIRISL